MRSAMLSMAASLLAASPGSAIAAEHPQGVPLWRNLLSGMSKAQVAALYPTRKGELSPGCEVDLRFIYGKGGLVSVVLQGRQRQYECHRAAIDALKRRHGEGESKEMSGGFGYGSGMTISYFTRLTWRAGPVKITAIPIGNMGWIGYTVKTNDKYW